MDRITIGLIGVGKMGVGLGKNLLEKGFKVLAFDTSPANIDPLDEYGVTRVSAQNDILEKAGIIGITSATT